VYYRELAQGGASGEPSARAHPGLGLFCPGTRSFLTLFKSLLHTCVKAEQAANLESLLLELGLKDKDLALKQTMIQSATQQLHGALKSECQEATLVELVERLCKQKDTGNFFGKRNNLEFIYWEKCSL
jgi:hypothetical protein